MAARRRRTKYTWLPVIGSASSAVDQDDDYAGRAIGSILTPLDQSSGIIVADLTFDTPREGGAINAADNLGIQIQNEYILKRIVGKCFVGRDSTSVSGQATAVIVGCGFFVARASSENPIFPIGGDTSLGQIRNYNPLTSDQMREPWIWRRTWLLGNNNATGGGAGHSAPTHNTLYGSVADGPHIDSRVARRVGQDDRLFFAFASKNLPPNDDVAVSTQVSCFLDYRLLGKLTKAKGRSAF